MDIKHGYIEKLAYKASRNREKYLDTFREEVRKELELMAEDGRYQTCINVEDFPSDVINVIGDELRENRFKCSLVDGELLISLWHKIKN